MFVLGLVLWLLVWLTWLLVFDVGWRGCCVLKIEFDFLVVALSVSFGFAVLNCFI